jgi:hypothetical protein
MQTQRKALRLLNIILLGLFVANVVYLIVAMDRNSSELYHHDSLVVLLYVWIPINLFYLITLRKLVKINTVRFGLIPLNIFSIVFFCLVASDYANGISGSECLGFFILYFLFVLPLHLLLGLKIRQVIEKKVLLKMLSISMLSSGILSVIITIFLFFAYFHGFIFQHVIMALILFMLFSLVSIILLSLWRRLSLQMSN